MIAILDYGLGNVRAFANIYSSAGIAHAIVATADGLNDATHVILPGVGAFDQAMTRLADTGLTDGLKAKVEAGVPILGVCVGMQMLMERSEEGVLPGLGFIKGSVVRFADTATGSGLQVPHMGWNDIAVSRAVPLLDGLDGEAFYFLHSYFCAVDSTDDQAATTDYGRRFVCAAAAGRVHGVQFHPEKSHAAGVRLLTNFAAL